MRSQVVELPWPPKGLSPNARVHWAVRHKLAKTYRETCRLLGKQAGLAAPGEGRLLLDMEFVPPDRRRRDDDNMIGAFKYARDGLAAAMGIDDHRFIAQFRVAGTPVKGGAVRVQIREVDKQA